MHFAEYKFARSVREPLKDLHEGGKEQEEVKTGIIMTFVGYWIEHAYQPMAIWYGETSLYKFFHQICMTQTFSNLILLAIGVNTVCMSMDRYPIEVEEAARLEIINSVCTWVFISEMICKLIGLGIATYAQESMNLFDAAIVIVSVVEMALASGEEDEEEQSGGMTLTIFRAFRLLRMFRLFRHWHSFHRMTTKMIETLKDILIFFVLLLIIVLVFSLLGVELFTNYAKFDSNGRIDAESGLSPRMNFDDPYNGIISVFTCLIGDDWNEIMHNMIRAHKNRQITCIYFLLLMVVGNLILMNLFLAILLKNFEEKSIDID